MDQYKDWIIHGMLRLPSYGNTQTPVPPIDLQLAEGGFGGLNGTYYYRVEVLDGESGWGLFWLSAEKAITVSVFKTVNLSWSAIPGAGTYNIYRGTSPGSYDKLIQTTNLSITDTGSIGGAPGGPPNTDDYSTILTALTAGATFVRITGPTESYNVIGIFNGISGTFDGRVVILFNEAPTSESSISMRIWSEHILATANTRIWTLKFQDSMPPSSPYGRSLQLSGRAIAGFIYDQAAASGVGRWIHLFSYGSTVS